MMGAPSLPASARRVARQTLPVRGVAILCVSAAILGAVLAGSLGGDDAPAPPPAAAPRSIAHEGLRVGLPSGWARGAAEAMPGFTRPLGLRNARDGLRASVELLPATSRTLLPAAFLQALGSKPGRPDVVELASGAHAWRYRFHKDGSTTIVYAAPATGGVATLACVSRGEVGPPRGCVALGGAVTVPGARLLEPDATAAFYSRFPAALAELDEARVTGLRRLGAAASAADQALAADGVARAHKTAGEILAPLTGAGDGLPTATVGELTAAAVAYSALAKAARARSPQSYAAAREAVAASDRRLRATVGKLAAATADRTRVATRSVRTTADTRPAAAKRPAGGATAATSSSGGDWFAFVLVPLLVGAIFLAFRAARRVVGWDNVP